MTQTCTLPAVFKNNEPLEIKSSQRPFKLSIGKNKDTIDFKDLMEKIYARYLPDYVCPHPHCFDIIRNRKEHQTAEMVGDKLLNAAITVVLSQPKYLITNEGTLTEVFNRLSNTHALSEMARILHFDKVLGNNPSCDHLEDAMEVFVYCIFAAHSTGFAPLAFIRRFYELHNPVIDPSLPYFTTYMSYENTHKLPTLLTNVTCKVQECGTVRYRHTYNFHDLKLVYVAYGEGFEKAFKADACRRYLESRPDYTEFKIKTALSRVREPSKALTQAITHLIIMGNYVKYDERRERFLVVENRDSGNMPMVRNTCVTKDFSAAEVIQYMAAVNTKFTIGLSDEIDPRYGMINSLLLLYEKLHTMTPDVEDPLNTFLYGVDYGSKRFVIGQSSTRQLFIYFRKEKVAFYGDHYGIPELLAGRDITIHNNPKYSDVKFIVKAAHETFM